MTANEMTAEIEIPLAEAHHAVNLEMVRLKEVGDAETFTELENVHNAISEALSLLNEVQIKLVKKQISKNLGLED